MQTSNCCLGCGESMREIGATAALRHCMLGCATLIYSICPDCAALVTGGTEKDRQALLMRVELALLEAGGHS